MDRGEALYDTRERTVTGHKFKIGQLVNYLGRDRVFGAYQVTQLLGALRQEKFCGSVRKSALDELTACSLVFSSCSRAIRVSEF